MRSALSVRPSCAIAIAALVSSLAAPLTLANNTASPIEHLAGRWVGPGKLVPASGPSQPFDCTVTYIRQSESRGLKQTLRCKSEGMKFEAAANLIFDGAVIRGHWEDRVNSVDGPVAGKVTPTGFEVELQGLYFQASMAVAGNTCTQTVKVNPKRADVIRELSADLKKC